MSDIDRLQETFARFLDIATVAELRQMAAILEAKPDASDDLLAIAAHLRSLADQMEAQPEEVQA